LLPYKGKRETSPHPQHFNLGHWGISVSLTRVSILVFDAAQPVQEIFMASSISGNVGVVGATVNLNGRTATGATFATTPSDSSSNYSFSNLAAGIYTISASLFGYRFSSKVITVDGTITPSGINLGSTAVSNSNNPNNNPSSYSSSSKNDPQSSVPF
jgi:hypothetical protein